VVPARFTLLDPQALLPPAWRALAGEGPVRVFNPGIIGDPRGGWIFACRVVLPDLVRRIALCRLDPLFRVVEGTQTPFSDQVRFAGDALSPRARAWFADPRLFRLSGRLFVYWNSGWHDPFNHQLIHELDPRTLAPVGGPRELVLGGGERQVIEKNWTFFGEGYAVYSATPHRVMSCSLDGDGAIALLPSATTAWAAGSALRGGAPPQLVGDHWYSICHAHRPTADGLGYIALVYRFSAVHPFAPTDRPARPLALDNPFGSRTLHERLNPVVGAVLYPSGAAFDGGHWTVSYGINDEHCAVAHLPHTELLATLVPLGGA
jgi:hypothetical protein